MRHINGTDPIHGVWIEESGIKLHHMNQAGGHIKQETILDLVLKRYCLLYKTRNFIRSCNLHGNKDLCQIQRCQDLGFFFLGFSFHGKLIIFKLKILIHTQMSFQYNISKVYCQQECIPVGYLPPAAVGVKQMRGGLPQCMLGYTPPWV